MTCVRTRTILSFTVMYAKVLKCQTNTQHTAYRYQVWDCVPSTGVCTKYRTVYQVQECVLSAGVRTKYRTVYQVQECPPSIGVCTKYRSVYQVQECVPSTGLCTKYRTVYQVQQTGIRARGYWRTPIPVCTTTAVHTIARLQSSEELSCLHYCMTMTVYTIDLPSRSPFVLPRSSLLHGVDRCALHVSGLTIGSGHFFIS